MRSVRDYRAHLVLEESVRPVDRRVLKVMVDAPAIAEPWVAAVKSWSWARRSLQPVPN